MPFAFNFSPLLAVQLTSRGTGISPLVVMGTIIVTLGLACDALIINRFLPTLQFRVTPKQWGLHELGVAVVIMVGLFSFSTLAYDLIAHLRHKDIQEIAPLIVPAELVLRLVILAGFVLFFQARKIAIRPALGLDAAKPARAAGWGTLFALASLPPVGVMILLNNGICRLIHVNLSEQPIVDLFLQTKSPTLLVILVLFAVVIAPVFEEFLFRGFAYPALKQRFGMWPALLMVSAVFSLNHMHAPSLLPLFVLAIGLTLAYELTGSLLASITMHSFFNTIMVLQMFYQRGGAR